MRAGEGRAGGAGGWRRGGRARDGRRMLAARTRLTLVSATEGGAQICYFKCGRG
jgi:hypothetical protein